MLFWALVVLAATRATLSAALGGNVGLQATLQDVLQAAAQGGDISTARRPADLQRIKQGSVRHFPIPGVLTLRDGAREAVIMHVYLRSQPRGDVVVFRGFMFAESVERDWYSLLDGYVCQPDVAQHTWPGIVLREAGGKREHRLRVFTELPFSHEANKPAPGTDNYNRTCMPYPFLGEVSAAEAACDLRIAIDGFKKTAHYSMARQRQLQARVRLGPGTPGGEAPLPRAAAVVLYPFTPATEVGVAVALLLQHVAYHTQLGFAKVVQYTQVAFLAAFLADERLRAHVRAGQLELVLWDHLGECVGPPHMRCWQPIVYSHALLEAWGNGALLLISDIDEYFVLPKRGMTLAGVLEGCTGGKSMIRVSRYDVFASREAEAALPRGAAEVALWRPGALGELKVRGASPDTHPLALYSIRSVGPIKLGKSMVDPDRTAAFEARAAFARVHNGMLFPRTANRALFWQDQKEDRINMNDECGFIAHVNNLFAMRLRPGDYPVMPDTSWHWILGSVVKPLK